MPIDAADTAWVLTATALVLLMTPGLALFYGGLVRRKMSWVLLKAVSLVVPLRVTPEVEAKGLDANQHGETAYGFAR